MTLSLRLRLAIASLVVSLLFLGLVGVVLDRGFREATRQAVQERLQARVYILLGVMEVDGSGLPLLPAELPEARFSSPGSGLYARVLAADGRSLWRSASLLGITLPPTSPLGAGATSYGHHAPKRADGLFLLSFGLEWEDDNGHWWGFTLQVAETDAAYRTQVRGFRRQLWSGLGAAGVALLVTQLLILGWGLGPLRRAGRELVAVQSGTRQRLGGGYPRELAQLTERINRFIAQQEEARGRYRNSLGDLAHSLKTPLAVLGSALDRRECDGDDARAQLTRMREIVDYQLGRAGAVGALPLAPAVPIAPLATSLRASLDKVRAERQIDCRLCIASDLVFAADRGDLLELLGNLLDNAYKWAARRVVVGAELVAGEGGRCLRLWVEDDGPGIAPDQAAIVLRRGERGVAVGVDGQGIGLAVVREVAAAYRGRVQLEHSELGGLRVRIELSVD